MGLLLGYSILNLPTMILFCYGFIKKTTLDRKTLISNNQENNKINNSFLSNSSVAMSEESPINRDTSIDRNLEQTIKKLNASEAELPLIIENLHNRLKFVEDQLR